PCPWNRRNLQSVELRTTFTKEEAPRGDPHGERKLDDRLAVPSRLPRRRLRPFLRPQLLRAQGREGHPGVPGSGHLRSVPGSPGLPGIRAPDPRSPRDLGRPERAGAPVPAPGPRAGAPGGRTGFAPSTT